MYRNEQFKIIRKLIFKILKPSEAKREKQKQTYLIMYFLEIM